MRRGTRTGLSNFNTAKVPLSGQSDTSQIEPVRSISIDLTDWLSNIRISTINSRASEI